MTNDFNEKSQNYSDESLEELLADVTDAKERERLTKAWNAFGTMSEERHDPPNPSQELHMIFRIGVENQRVDEQLSENELEMLSAAGKESRGEDWDGSSGNDTHYGGLYGDNLDGHGGDDAVHGRGGNDVIWGGDGDDSLSGGSGQDYLSGDGGNDLLDGGSGDDVLRGGDGDDSLIGGSGNDTLVGGEGNDTLVGGEGDDLLSGGAGNDVFYFAGSDGEDIISDFTPGEDTIQVPEGTEMRVGVNEDGDIVISFGPDSHVTLHGVSGSDWGLEGTDGPANTERFLELGWVEYSS